MPTTDEVRQSAGALLARLDKLHSAPGVVLRVLEITSQPDFDVSNVVECLERDPPLSGSILRSVNSAHYGLSHKINNLTQAVAYLGRRSLRLNVLSFGLVNGFVREAPAALHKEYWKRSLTMAAGARQLAQMAGFGCIDVETAFTGGLLADLGMLAIAQVETETYLEECFGASHIVELVAREREVFGFDHMATGFLLMEDWGLPPELASAVAWHHSYVHEAPRFHHLMLTANLLAEALCASEGHHIVPLRWMMEKYFNLDIDALITLAVDTKESVKQSADLFDVRLDEEIDLEMLHQQAQVLREMELQPSVAHIKNFVICCDPKTPALDPVQI